MRWFGRRRQREAGDIQTLASPRFQWMGGRRYLTEAPYMLPAADSKEINRLDFQHYMLRYALQGNYAALIGQPKDILDVGCGTGIWPMELATTFPHANVIGVDISTPPMDSGMRADKRPENYLFVTGDVLKGLSFPPASFDFVHQRLLMSAIPATRWQGVVNELARMTRPGGWIELVEASPVEGAPALDMLKAWQVQLTAKRDIDIMIGTKIESFLKNAGLQNGATRQIHVPIGKQQGHVGAMSEANYFAVMETLRGPMTAMGIAAPDIFDETIRVAHAEIASGKLVNVFYLSYGQVR